MPSEIRMVSDIAAFERDLPCNGSACAPDDAGPKIRRVEDIPLLSDCAARPIAFVHDPELIEGSITAWTGDSGSGKTSLAQAIAGEVVRAGRPVLFLDRENPQSVVMERYSRFHIVDGPMLRYWGGWLPEEAPQIGSGIVIEWAIRCDPKPLIIQDSVSSFYSGNQNDAGEMRAFIHQARRVADLGATVLLNHHDGKSETARDYRGSSDFKAAVDQAFHVRNSSPDGRLGTLTLRCYKSRFGFPVGGEIVYHYRDGLFLRDTDPTAPARTVTQQLADLLRSNPAIKARDFEHLANDKGLGRNRARTFLNDGILSGCIRRESSGRTTRHYLISEVPTDAD